MRPRPLDPKSRLTILGLLVVYGSLSLVVVLLSWVVVAAMICLVELIS